MKKAQTRSPIVFPNTELTSGLISARGKLHEETQSLPVSSLIPYIARDIFLAQKEGRLIEAHFEIKPSSNSSSPHISIILFKEIDNDALEESQNRLSKILWQYNYLTYDMREDTLKKRFSYSFHQHKS